MYYTYRIYLQIKMLTHAFLNATDNPELLEK